MVNKGEYRIFGLCFEFTGRKTRPNIKYFVRLNCSDNFQSWIELYVSSLDVGGRGRKTKKQDGFQFDPMESAVVAGRGDKCDGYR
ncbi:hypothetical protein V1477_000653 [Vespula maculifrons]|uniref:Uncharacterized protein n=1 Tax=Vespula maculifrons TaxID=7453 RepID=A0ABD2D3G5_VESMC